MAITDKDLEDYERFLRVNSSKEPIISKIEMDNFIPPDETPIEQIKKYNHPAIYTHGGKRQGAGRPKLPQTRKRVIFTLSPEIIAKLKDEKNRSGLIETLLIEYFKEHNQ